MNVTQDDIQAAQRGLRMVAMPISELTDLRTVHDKPVAQRLFADEVIVRAVDQMISVKKRLMMVDDLG